MKCEIRIPDYKTYLDVTRHITAPLGASCW